MRINPSSRAVSSLAPAIAVALVALLLVPGGLVSASGGNATLQGFILTGSGSPIAGASVRITASDVPWVFQATTDGTGHYLVTLPNHEYTFQASAPAFYANSTTVGVGSGESLWFNMTLVAAAARTAFLQGYVTDASNSTPVRTGRVVLAMPWWVSGLQYTNASTLNAAGYYAMNVTAGTYQLSTDGVQGYLPYAYSYLYPNAGQVRWYNFTMTPMPLVSWVNGTVRDANNGTALAGASVQAYVSGLRIAATTSNATGGYSVRAPVATVLIAADASGYAPGTTNAYVYWAGAFTANVALTPLSTGLRGYVRDGLTGRGIPDVLVPVTSIFSSGYFDQATTNSTGYYAVALPPDDYSTSVAVSGYAGTYAYAYLGAGTVSWLNLTLWPLVSTVRGYLIDGSTGLPVPSFGVRAYDARSGYSAYATSDATGLFSFLLPPSPAITLSVYGYAPYVGAVVYLATVPYATVWANITLPRASAQVTATVVDGLTGLPISAASVSASWSLGSAFASTNASGVAVLAVPSGLPLSVGAWAAGHLTWYGTLDPVASAASLTIVLFPALAENVTVEGYVLAAPTNASLTFAYVTVSGYGSLTSSTYTGGTGYYSLSTVAAAQTVVASAYGYAAGKASIHPATGGILWLNFTLSADTTAPVIVDFTATPSTNVGPANPTSLLAHVNESDLSAATLSLYMMRSSAGGVGTFLNLGTIPSNDVSVAPSTPGNVTVSSSWDTRTPVALLSDGVSTDWWPATTSYWPYEVAVPGFWDNATLASPVYATAYFDTRSGRLLYVTTSSGYITGADQPTSTFQPYTWGIQVNLTTAAMGGSVLVTGSTYSLGQLGLTLANAVPGGQYAVVLQAQDFAGHVASAAVLLQVAADTTPPVARAGSPQTVNQGTRVTLDGSASTDDTGVVNYTWTFVDGVAKTLYGAKVTYLFLNAGTFTVTLTVRDAAGNRASATTTVTVLDTTPPTVAFTYPLDGGNLSGTVVLMASATDNVGVVRVEFLADGNALGNATTAPYTLGLNTAALANGAHTLTAVAYDAAGNHATASLHVVVSNASGLLGLDLGTWILAVVLIVAAVGVLVVLLRRRQKKALSPPQPPPPMPPANP